MPTRRDSRAPVHQKNGSLTCHEIAIRMLVNGHPDMHRNGFRQAVIGLWEAIREPDDDCWMDDVPRMGFLPDAYRLDRESSEILIYEVEDTHAIPAVKLDKLGYFWFECDAEGRHDWLPRLFIVNRYGSISTEVDLMGVYYASCLEGDVARA